MISKKSFDLIGFGNQEVTYTFREYREYLEAKEDTGKYIYNKLMSTERMKKITVLFLALTTNFGNAVQTFADPLVIDSAKQNARIEAEKKTQEAFTRIDIGGTMILSMIQKIGFWVCIVMCAIEILKCLFNGDNRDIMRIVIKYLMAFASLYVLPMFFDFIVGIFGGF